MNLASRSIPIGAAVRIVAFLVAAALTSPRTAPGNPSHANPEAVFPPNGLEVVSARYANMVSLYEKGHAELQGYEKVVGENRGNRLAPKAMADTYRVLFQADRLAQQLKMLGEPAAYDLALRAGQDRGRVAHFIRQWAALPTSQNVLQAIRQALAKAEPQRTKILERMIKLASEQQWEQAENVQWELFDGLESQLVFLSDEEGKAIRRPFEEVRGAIMQAMGRLRTAKARELLTQERDRHVPNYAGTLAQLDAAVAAIGTTGSAAWGDQTATGPQLMALIEPRWKELQAAALRQRAFDWLARSVVGFNYESAMEEQQPRDSAAETYAQFCTDLTNRLAQLIQADTRRLTGDAAATAYIEYLRACAPLVRQSDHQRLAGVLQSALAQLAAKHPPLAAQIQAYADVTTELLRWRQRVARARAAPRLTQDRPLPDLFLAAFQSKLAEQYSGLFPEQQPDPQVAVLNETAPKTLLPRIPRLMAATASVSDVIRVSPASKSSVARYRQRTFANVPVLDLAAEVAALKFDLMVSDQASPLTLAAAVAVQSAERGDLAAAGGTISGLYLEGVATRFATLPAAAAVLAPLDALPVEKFESGYQAPMMMRFDLTPAWAQHEYFFVEWK